MIDINFVTYIGGLNLKTGNMMIVVNSEMPIKIQASFTTEKCSSPMSNTYGAPLLSIDIRTCYHSFNNNYKDFLKLYM